MNMEEFRTIEEIREQSFFSMITSFSCPGGFRFWSFGSLIISMDFIYFAIMVAFGELKTSGYYLLPLKEDTIIVFGALSPFRLYNRHEFWRFFTYVFIHANVNHLLIEAIVKFIFFHYFDGLLGWKSTAFMYLVNTVAGGLFSCLLFDDLLYGGGVPLMGYLGCHLALIIVILVRDPNYHRAVRNTTLVFLLALCVFISLADFSSSIGIVGTIVCGWNLTFAMIKMPNEGNNVCLKILRIVSFFIIGMFIHFGLILFFLARAPGPSYILDMGNPFMGSKHVDIRYN